MVSIITAFLIGLILSYQIQKSRIKRKEKQLEIFKRKFFREMQENINLENRLYYLKAFIRGLNG